MLALVPTHTLAFGGAAVPAMLSRAAVPSMGLESELGATGPLLPYWDPLGLGQNASPEKLARWQAVETKHGRIAMLAVRVGSGHELWLWSNRLRL